MVTRITLADVPPVPGDADLVRKGGDDTPDPFGANADVVLVTDTERWRIRVDGTIVYYIQYAADGKGQVAVYRGPRA